MILFQTLWRWLRRPPILSSRDAYRRWAKAYPPHAHNPFMTLEEATMRDLLPPLTGQRVLDLACGTGRWGRIAAAAGAASILSSDDSAAMLHAGQPSSPMQAGMDAIPLSAESVDVILCGLAVGHLDRGGFQMAIREMGRVLAPGGIALISDVHPVRGWMGMQRHFTVGGKTYAVMHHIHSYAEYHQATAAAGLRIAAVREAAPQPDQPPALLVVQLRKNKKGSSWDYHRDY